MAVLFEFACSNSKQTEMARFAREFSVTNITVTGKNGAPAVETIILRTNGVYFASLADQAAIHLGDKYAITIFFDPDSKRVSRIVQETSSDDASFWMIDINGDGLADLRRKMGETSQDILLDGKWIPSSGSGTNKTVSLGDKAIPVEFQDGRWRLRKPGLQNLKE